MTHVLNVQVGDGRAVRRGDIVSRSLLLAIVRERLVLGIQELQAVEHVDLLIGKLFFDELFLLGLGGDMLDKGVRIADRSGHHARGRVLVLADHADDLQFQPVVVERAQTKLFGGEVDILLLRLVIAKHIRRENVSEARPADLLIAPALDLALHRLLRDEALHVLGDRACRLQTERVQHEVRDLVVFIDDQHRLVVTLGPFAVKNVILLFQKRADGLSVLSRKHLLPDVDDGIIRTVGVEKRAVIAAVHAAHRSLQKLYDVGLRDVPLFVLGKKVHIEVIGILDGAQIPGDLAVFILDVGLEGLEVVRLLVSGDHGVHHIVHDGARIDRVAVVRAAFGLRAHAHQRGHHVGHVDAFGLDRDRIA